MPHQPTPADAPARRLLTARETAKLLGISWRSVYRHADAGKLPFGVKIGASRRWDRAELEAFIANGCKMPTLSKRRGAAQ